MEPVEQVTVVLGSLVTLACEARGMPPPSLSWLKDGQPLSLHRNLLLDGQETRLHLTAVASHDAGLYSCVASNAAGSSTKTFNLTVLGEKRPTSVHQLFQAFRYVYIGYDTLFRYISEGYGNISASGILANNMYHTNRFTFTFIFI